MGYHEKQQRWLLTFLLRSCHKSPTGALLQLRHTSGLWRYHAFLLCLLDIKIVHTLSNKATGSQQERKKAHLSLCMPTPYTTTTHVAMLLEERIITFLFPSSENEGFSQEFQSLGAQANS
jgi:hypothetical protein